MHLSQGRGVKVRKNTQVIYDFAHWGRRSPGQSLSVGNRRKECARRPSLSGLPAGPLQPPGMHWVWSWSSAGSQPTSAPCHVWYPEPRTVPHTSDTHCQVSQWPSQTGSTLGKTGMRLHRRISLSHQLSTVSGPSFVSYGTGLLLPTSAMQVSR